MHNSTPILLYNLRGTTTTDRQDHTYVLWKVPTLVIHTKQSIGYCPAMNQASVQQHALLQPLDRKRVAIVLSNYIPWRGYFAIVDAADVFILLDPAQYTRRDWRNRHKLKTLGGTMWLSIPAENTGRDS